MSSTPAIARFSTDALPERDRVPMWREWIGRSLLNCDITPMGEEELRWEASNRGLADLNVSNVRSTPSEMSRSKAQAADGNDDFVLGMVRSSGMFARQGNREAFTSAGQASLWSNELAGTSSQLKGFEMQSVAVPRRILAPMVPNLDSLVLSPVPRDSAALKLLSSYVSTLFDDTVVMSPELKALSSTHIQDLVAVTLGATRDATEIAKGRGVRVARLKAIKADIDRHLTSRDLSMEGIARRHRISGRYVRTLFESEGTSFTDYVLKMRLLAAYGALCKPANAHLKISTVAFESGFGDLSYFNLAFRRHFGITPSDARALARKI